MKRSPYFSVLIPTYHAHAWLPDALTSLQAQTFQDFEVIIAPDDGLDYHSFRTDQRIRILERSRVGTGAGPSRNDAFAASRGQFVVMLDADDLLPPNYLHAFQLHFASSNSPPVAVAPTEIFDSTGSLALRGAHGRSIGVVDFAWSLASVHIVCHRSAHVPWLDCFAEDVVRDAHLIARCEEVPVLLDTRYRLRSHAGQSTARITDERFVRSSYDRTARSSLSAGVAEVLAIRTAANIFFDRFRAVGERWYEFFSRVELSLGSVYDVLATSCARLTQERF